MRAAQRRYTRPPLRRPTVYLSNTNTAPRPLRLTPLLVRKPRRTLHLPRSSPAFRPMEDLETYTGMGLWAGRKEYPGCGFRLRAGGELLVEGLSG